MSVDAINSAARATDKGTPIQKPGNDMDKNAFLRILSAELSNQNPDDSKDSTQYVAQMAQFSSLEQMANLNSNITFSGASAIIGKSVTMSDLDMDGNQYTGVVKSVVKDAGVVTLQVEVMDNGKKTTINFPYDDVSSIDN